MGWRRQFGIGARAFVHEDIRHVHGQNLYEGLAGLFPRADAVRLPS